MANTVGSDSEIHVSMANPCNLLWECPIRVQKKWLNLTILNGIQDNIVVSEPMIFRDMAEDVADQLDLVILKSMV